MGPITLTDDNFSQEVLQYNGVVLVDFWATWCGPCRAFAPTLDEVAAQRSDVKVGKVDVDQCSELTRQYRVMSVPTLLVFKDGQLVRREVGGKSKDEVLEMLA